MNYSNKGGYLELIIGPMFSGKTTKIIEIYNKYKDIFNILVVNYIGDDRYSTTEIVSHNGIKIPTISLKNLSDIDNNIIYSQKMNDISMIIINEGQFFKDIYEWVKIQTDFYKKNIIVCGLDGDYKREPFTNFIKLIPLANNIIKVSGVCKSCADGTPSVFTYRKTNELTQEVIGTDIYIPVCRTCYLKLEQLKAQNCPNNYIMPTYHSSASNYDYSLF